MGTMGSAIPLRVPTVAAHVANAVNQIGTLRPPDPIMRRPCADREEKRATHDGRNGLTQRNSLTSMTPIREGSQMCSSTHSTAIDRKEFNVAIRLWPRLHDFVIVSTGPAMKQRRIGRNLASCMNMQGPEPCVL